MKTKNRNTIGRRDMLTAIGAAAAGLAAGAVSSAEAAEPQPATDRQESLRRRAEQGPAVPALLPANAVRPQPDELLSRQ